MGSARNILYGFASALLLFSVAVAIQQSYLGHLNSVIAASQPQRNAKPGVPGTSAWAPLGRGSSVFSEREAWTDVAPDARQVDPSKRGGPASSTATPRTGQGSFSTNQGSAAGEGWINRIPAALASAFSFGSEAPVAPRPSVPLSQVPTANQGQVKEVFFSEREETACQPGNQEFTLEDIRGLYVCVIWAGLAGTYAEQLTFVSPDGHVYQTLTQAFATAQAPALGTVEVEGRRYAVKPAGWGANGETLVTAALPVAGTFITQYNLTGLWTVKVALNGEPIGQDTFQLLRRP